MNIVPYQAVSRDLAEREKALSSTRRAPQGYGGTPTLSSETVQAGRELDRIGRLVCFCCDLETPQCFLHAAFHLPSPRQQQLHHSV
jgi:hypothetical protein